MIRHVWSVLCQSASIDAQTNRVSLFNVLEGLMTMGEPSAERPALLRGELVSLWTGTDADETTKGKMRVKVIDPEGEEVAEVGLELDISGRTFHRTRINIEAMAIKKLGEHLFRVEFQAEGEEQWHLGTELPLRVTQKLPAEE